MRKREMNVKIIEQENRGLWFFDKSIGVYFQVNHVGKLLLEGLIEGKSRNELVEELEETFDLEKPNAENDVDEFLSMLREAGIA